METKYVRVPFEVELAKKITEKSVDGRIVTRDGRSARVICFDAHCEDNIVALVEDSLGIESTFNYLNDGKFYIGDEKECDLFIEIPEYMTFKDGDVIVYDRCVLLFSGDVNLYDLCGCYCSLFGDTESLDLNFDYKGVFQETRLATEEEKQKLIEELKASKDPLAKECLKKLGIEVKQEYEFKPFDKVLVRDNYKDSKWGCDLFSHKNKDGLYVCIGEIWENCIPYEGNEHLLGTTEKYE